MAVGIWFWIIWVIALVFGCVGYYTQPNRWWGGMSLVVWILLGLLGWGIFGSPIKGG